jgi:hypothetical protein
MVCYLRKHISLFFLIFLSTFLSTDLTHGESGSALDCNSQIIEKKKCPMNRDYFLYLPKTLDPNRTYWLVSYVHGAYGFGRDDIRSLKHFVELGNCIGVAPSFGSGFQLLENKTDEQLIGILHQLRATYKLHPKIFLYGHSAGGQFSHRFMLKHPDLVIGCEACSSGTWATGGKFGSILSNSHNELDSHDRCATQNIPIAIACGSKDQGNVGYRIQLLSSQDPSGFPPSVGNKHEISTFNRVQWFKEFEHQLHQGNFFYKSKLFCGEGHYVDESEQEALALESFSLGTCGMLPEEKFFFNGEFAEIKKDISNQKCDFNDKRLQQLKLQMEERSTMSLEKKLTTCGWHVNEHALEQCHQALKEFLDEEIILTEKEAHLIPTT